VKVGNTMLKITAIIAFHNTEKTLAPVLEHLKNNAIDVAIINNGANKKTMDIVARYMGTTVKIIKDQPYDGIFHLKEQLLLKEQIMREIEADWVIHLDSDEILQSPRESESLRQFIERMDSQGYDVIDCDEFVFVPMQPDDEEPEDFVRDIRHYYYFRSLSVQHHRVQRVKGACMDWSRTGGHMVSLEGRTLASEKLRKRHYIGISFDHLRGQYLSRINDAAEVKKGWFNTREIGGYDYIVRPSIKLLNDLDSDGWKTDRPYSRHLIFKGLEQNAYRSRFRRGLFLLFKNPEKFMKIIRSKWRNYFPISDKKGNNESAPCVDAFSPMPFVVGVARSGTTLLRSLLDAHPDMAIPTETQWFAGVIGVMLRNPGDVRGIVKEIRLSPNWLEREVRNGVLKNILKLHEQSNPGNTIRRIYAAYAAKHGAKRYGDKTPRHSNFMADISKILPEARFVHIIRDGRDVALSLREVWWGTKDIRRAACTWINTIREARQQAQELPHYMEVRFHELVENPDKVLRDIGAFLEIDLDYTRLCKTSNPQRNAINLQENSSMVLDKNQSKKNMRFTSLDDSRINRWKTEMPPEEIAAFERIAGDMLSDLGYERTT